MNAFVSSKVAVNSRKFFKNKLLLEVSTVMANKAYSLTIINNSDADLFFTLFSYNTKEPSKNFHRILPFGKGISKSQSDVFQWPVNLKVPYNPFEVFYVAASPIIPIVGTDLSTEIANMTISLDCRTETGRTKTVKFSQFNSVLNQSVEFHCACGQHTMDDNLSEESDVPQSEVPSQGSSSVDGPLHGVAETSLIWKPGSTIRFRFLDDGEHDTADRIFVRGIIQVIANEWFSRINLTAVFYDRPIALNTVNTNTDFIIGFDTNIGTLTALGTKGIRRARQGRVTMNLAECSKFEYDYGQQRFETVILHEFGHAIGLDHEHQSPNRTIYISRAAVVARENIARYNANQPELVDTKNTPDAAAIDIIMLQWLGYTIPWYKPSKYTTSAFDPQSIMIYSVPFALQFGPEDGNIPGTNTPYPPKQVIVMPHTLSAGDIAFAQQLYGAKP